MEFWMQVLGTILILLGLFNFKFDKVCIILGFILWFVTYFSDDDDYM